jgi:N6-L-threonylcarbamoyladenine synthase
MSELVLAIESSCDETGIALVGGGRRIQANVVASQVALHAQAGGIVPEAAARAHLRWILPALDEAWQTAGVTWADIAAVTVTEGPGLAGSLLVGINVAKTLAWFRRKPLVGVNHLEGHIYAAWLIDPGAPEREAPRFPAVALVVSGGHTFLAEMRDHLTYRLLGETVDDAAGEAFDKGARLLGLGYPGGPAIQQAAEEGDRDAFEFPVAMSERGLDFSFSGLKTSLVYRVRDLGPKEAKRRLTDLAASFQRAITDQLVRKLERAARTGEWPAIALGGGVAANAELRARTEALCDQLGLRLKLVPLSLCTDNAAMIAAAARHADPIPYPEYLDFDAFASSPSVRAA